MYDRTLSLFFIENGLIAYVTVTMIECPGVIAWVMLFVNEETNTHEVLVH